jgi:diguanylate cyclase (GGDEF)-like protein/PAS domain S-box-containing protein
MDMSALPLGRQGSPEDPGCGSLPRSAGVALVGQLYHRLPFVLAMNLAVALGTVVVFWQDQPWPLLMAWLAAMTAILAVRLYHWHEFRRVDPELSPGPWARRFTLGAGLTGAVWGLAGVLFYAPDSPVAQIYLPFVLAGMVGGSLTALTGHTPAFVAFCVGALAPYGVRLALEGDPAHLTMAALVLLYMIGIGLLGRHINRSLFAGVRLAVENQALIGALQQKSAQLEATFDHVHQGVAVFQRDGRLVTWNPRHRELHGYPAELYRSGTPLTEFLRHDLARGAAAAGPGAVGDEELRAASLRPAPARFEQAGAGERILEVERSPMPDGGFVSTSTDITERKRSEARMLHLAQHDPLTGVPNRLLFQDRLGLAMARCRRHGHLLAVMLIDLDRFKEINDVFGHRVGDQVLQETATRLRGRLRDSDTVARIGGDEFALILPDLAEPAAASLIAQAILARLERPFELDGRVLELRASLGIALFPTDGESAEQLLQNADLAMYRAKATGGGVRPFGAAIKRAFDHRQTLERELGRAIAHSRLRLEYQPQLDLRRQRISGVEALLRWDHPQLGPIDPATVIEVAEASGQMARLGEWALREACQAAARWAHATPEPIRVAVNFSAAELARDDLLGVVRRILEEAGLPPQRLQLELTESTRLTEIGRIASVLERLRAMGVSLAFDDFGTGYAHLGHLKELPFDALKIDRSFTADLADDPAAPIVRSLIELGHRLGLRVIAEGVESQGQLAALRALGCDEAQGDVIAPPLAPSAMAKWLSARLDAATQGDLLRPA